MSKQAWRSGSEMPISLHRAEADAKRVKTSTGECLCFSRNSSVSRQKEMGYSPVLDSQSWRRTA